MGIRTGFMPRIAHEGTRMDSSIVERSRARACAISLALALILAAVPSVSASATESTDNPAAAAAGWLATQLVDNERLEGSWVDEAGTRHVFDDHGGTADVVLALAAAGVAANHIDAARAWLVREHHNYTGIAFDAVSAGAVAKLALTLTVAGHNPRDVDGTDLVAALQAREVDADDGVNFGRFADSGPDDWSSTFTQALAVLALIRAEEPISDAAVAFLLAQQCDDGMFRFQPNDEPCTPDLDTTAMAIQALAPIEHAAVSRAAAALAAHQDDDGGYANANTTGLAAAALSVAGEEDAAQAARQFLLMLQDGCDGDATGAVAYDMSGEGDAVFATRQAVVGLAQANLTEISSQGASTAVPEGLSCVRARTIPTPLILVLVGIAAAALATVAVRRRQAQS